MRYICTHTYIGIVSENPHKTKTTIFGSCWNYALVLIKPENYHTQILFKVKNKCLEG